MALLRPDMIAVGTCLLGFFMFMTNYILLETIGVLLCQQQLGTAPAPAPAPAHELAAILAQDGPRIRVFVFWVS